MTEKTTQYQIDKVHHHRTAKEILEHYGVSEEDLHRLYQGLEKLCEKNGIKVVMTDMSKNVEENNGEEADHFETCTSDGEKVYLHNQLQDHGGIMTRVYDIMHMGCGHMIQRAAQQQSGLDRYGDKAWAIGSVFHMGADAHKLREVGEYEMEASELALQCVRDVLAHTLTDGPAENIVKLYSDYIRSDNHYILDYYKTGKSTNFFDGREFDQTPVKSHAVPSFVPHKRAIMEIGLIRNDG